MRRSLRTAVFAVLGVGICAGAFVGFSLTRDAVDYRAYAHISDMDFDGFILPSDYVHPRDTHIEIDMYQDADGAWCNPVDPVRFVTVGEEYQVAICLTTAPASPGSFRFNLTYDTALNECVPNSEGSSLDQNPDANAGVTVFDGMVSAPNGLGTGWDCNIDGVSPPSCGSSTGSAFLQCSKGDGTAELPVGPYTVEPVAVVTLRATAAGTGILGLEDVSVSDADGREFLTCAYYYRCLGAEYNNHAPWPSPTPTRSKTPTPVGTRTFTPTPPPTGTPTPPLPPTPLPGAARVELDMDPTNGSGPCNPVDAMAEHATGETYAVAVCLTDSPEAPGGFQFRLDFDGSLNQCVPVEIVGQARDTNPDANAGVTVFSNPDLGPNWDCFSQAQPRCGSTWSGYSAYLQCFTLLGPATLPHGAGVSSPLAEVRFRAYEPGIDNMLLDNLSVINMETEEIVGCDSGACYGGTDMKVGSPVPPLPSPSPTPPLPTPPPATPAPVGAAKLELDMDPNNGSGPCDPVDATAQHRVGDTYPVAICLTNSFASPNAFQLELLYDGDLNQCVPKTCSAEDERCLDSNPDANAGSTVFSAPSLGTGWTCNLADAMVPVCDKYPGGGDRRSAFLSCWNITTGETLPFGLGVSAPIAQVTLHASVGGTDTLELVEAAAYGTPLVTAIVSCYDTFQRGTCVGGTDVKVLAPTPHATPHGVGGKVLLPPDAVAAQAGDTHGDASRFAATWMALASIAAAALALTSWCARSRRRGD